MNYKKFDGKKIEDVAKHLKDISSYNHNYYEDDEGNIIYAGSDDADYTDYTRVTIIDNMKKLHETFAESFCSCGDFMEVFSEFINEQQTSESSEDYDEEDMLYNRAVGANDII